MINVNEENAKEDLVKAFHSKTGKLVIEYIKQVLREEFDINLVDLNADDAKVGQECKRILKFEKAFDKINKLVTPK